MTAEFTYDTKTIVLGETWKLDATIRTDNMRIGEVCVRAQNTADGDLLDDFSGHTDIPYEKNLKYFDAYIIDTNKYPFNRVGEYTLQISVKDADGYHSYDCLDEMTIKVVEKLEDKYENSIYFERLQNVDLTGNQGEDIVAVALSQVGYHEGSLMGNTNSDKNYTEYNRWLREQYKIGSDTQEWCAAFVSWCARKAGIGTDVLPNALNASPDSRDFQTSTQLCFQLCGPKAKEGAEVYTWKQYIDGEYQWQVGDLLFVGKESTSEVAAVGNKDLSCTHVAIITNITQTDNKVIVKTVEGNHSNQVEVYERKAKYGDASTGYYADGYYMKYFAHPNYQNVNP